MAYSNVMRYTGTSGVDTASMVEQLMKAESLKYDKLYKQNESVSYKQQSYQKVGNGLLDTQKKHFSFGNVSGGTSFRSSTAYSKNTLSVKNSSGYDSSNVTITPKDSAQSNVKHTVEVQQLATSSVVNYSAPGAGVGRAVLSESTSNLENGSNMKVTINGKTKTVTFNQADIDALNAADAQGKEDILNSKIDSTFGLGTSTKAGFKLNDKGGFDISATPGNKMSIADGTPVGTAPSTIQSLGFTGTSATTEKTANSSMWSLFNVDGPFAFDINGKSFEFDSTDSIKTVVDKINSSDAGVSAYYSTVTGELTFTSDGTGEDSKIDFNDTTGFFASIGGISSEELGQDSIAIIDGVTFQQSTNSVSTDEFDIGFNVAQVGETITFDATVDMSKTKATVMEFVEVYNNMLQSIYDETETKRPKASGKYYDPLSEEERKSLTETEVKDWDENAKKGLLFNDRYLNEIESQLRNAISQPVTLSDGSKLSLADLGISTGTYKAGNGGKLEVDEAKLDKALETYGDKVTEMFTREPDTKGDASTTGIAERVNNVLNANVGSQGTLTKKVGLQSSPLALTENPMTKELNNYSKEMAEMLKYLEKKENDYYIKFAAMEEALNASNAQMNALMSATFGAQ